MSYFPASDSFPNKITNDRPGLPNGDLADWCSAQRQILVAQEGNQGTLLTPDARSSKNLYINAFELELAGKNGMTPQDLTNAGVFRTSQDADAGGDRVSPVRDLVFRKSSELGPLANFRIDADGTIEMLKNPDKTDSPNDISVVVEFADSGTGQTQSQYEIEKASARQVMAYLGGYYPNAHLDGKSSADMWNLLYKETVMPTPSQMAGSPGYNGHPLLSQPYYSSAPQAAPLHGYNGRTHAGDVKESKLFHKVGPEAEYKNLGGLHKFIDNGLHQLSLHEGNFKSIRYHDAGGIDIGTAQWNTRVGEANSLFLNMYKADKTAFCRIFHLDAQTAQRLAAGNFQAIRHWDFNGNRALQDEVKTALAYEPFQKVQVQMVRDIFRHAIKLSDKYGHHSSEFVMQLADIGNQAGWGGAESALRRADVAHIHNESLAEKQLRAQIMKGKRTSIQHMMHSRDLKIRHSQLFSLNDDVRQFA